MMKPPTRANMYDAYINFLCLAFSFCVPQYTYCVYEGRVNSQVLVHADLSLKAGRDPDWPRQRFSVFVEVSVWPKFVCSLAKYGVVVLPMQTLAMHMAPFGMIVPLYQSYSAAV